MKATNLLVVCSSKASLSFQLHLAILECAEEAIRARGSFSVALSGGSLVSLLTTLKDTAANAGLNPEFQHWHVILADERIVALDDPNSNLGCLLRDFFSTVSIPSSHINGINQTIFADAYASTTADKVAADYDTVVRRVLQITGGFLDLAVLGFGPDGHTCSLFPGHKLLEETSRWVAGVEDSPKPPPKRITLTLPMLNGYTRSVIFCGAGASKSPILSACFASIDSLDDNHENAPLYEVTMSNPPPFPCAMVTPTVEHATVTWIVDEEAIQGDWLMAR